MYILKGGSNSGRVFRYLRIIKISEKSVVHTKNRKGNKSPEKKMKNKIKICIFAERVFVYSTQQGGKSGEKKSYKSNSK